MIGVLPKALIHHMKVLAVMPQGSAALISLLAIAVSLGCTKKEQPGETAVPLRIAFTNSPLALLPVILADSLGFYKKEGLSPTIDAFPNGAKTMQALLAGSDDIATGSYDQNLQIVAEGRDVKSFVLVLLRPSRAVVVSPRANARIHRIEDLKGAAVGVGGFGSITHLFLQYLLVKHGMAPDAAKIVSIGTGASAIASVEHQAVDAAVVTESDRIIIEKRVPQAATLLDVSTPAGCRQVYGVDRYPAGVIFATGAWLREHGDTARRTAHAIEDAVTWMSYRTPEQIWNTIPARYRMDRELDLETLRSLMPSFSPNGVIPRDGAEAARQSMSLISEKIRAAKFDLATTYTNEFLPKK